MRNVGWLWGRPTWDFSCSPPVHAAPVGAAPEPVAALAGTARLMGDRVQGEADAVAQRQVILIAGDLVHVTQDIGPPIVSTEVGQPSLSRRTESTSCLMICFHCSIK